MTVTHLATYRLPRGSGEHHHFSYGGGPIAVDRQSGALVVATRQRQYARLYPQEGTDILRLDFEGFRDLWPADQPPPEGSAPAGLLVDGDRIISTASIFYDANDTQRVGHFINGQWSAIWHSTEQGLVAGYMAWVPERLQGQLGDFLTGQCGIPIIHRTSYGPCAFTVTEMGDAYPLVYYTAQHQTLGPYEGGGELFNETMEIKGVAIIGDELVFGGRIGIGPRCYGNGINDPSLPPGGDTRNGEHFCHDPELADKGGHAYPYRYQLWRYKIDQVLAAENPWDLIPEITPIALAPGPTRLAGMAYDERNDILYLSQYAAENSDREAGYPLIHALRVTADVQPTPNPVPPVVTEPAPQPTELQLLTARIDALETSHRRLRDGLIAVLQQHVTG